jgi:hypothetical protein
MQGIGEPCMYRMKLITMLMLCVMARSASFSVHYGVGTKGIRHYKMLTSEIVYHVCPSKSDTPVLS